MDVLQSLRAKLETIVEELNKIQKDLGKAMNNRQSLQAQLTENMMVKSELDLLDDGAVVYKLVGPILVKQDVIESRSNVSKRISWIESEMKRTDERIQALTKKQDEKRIEMGNTQAKVQAQAARVMQSMSGAGVAAK
eukprot:CAMPEP_0184696484 /NCGR_PEP_ID=MMETSP0313-20130426/3760_1 /TAXON_ID=2792 /ORGANISM="Porphyridium aerugineum, Strain SAG 1380-2" /LENGTH=136 /DNA_ID=CAMNT_0027155115 /DNA_START=111 /DNA_END=521 /DNA_ORIENTATION=+